MIQARLKDFVKQQTNTKALFDSKLERAMMDIQDHTTLIEELQKELQMAKAQKKEFQQTMKTIQSQRQLEDERMHVQKLRLEIFQCCCSYDGEDPSTNNNNNPSNETTRETMNQIVQKFQNEDDEGAIFLSLSYQELVLIKRRLEGLLEMFQKAETAARSKKLEIRKQAAIMKQDVISKYVVLYQFQQII